MMLRRLPGKLKGLFFLFRKDLFIPSYLFIFFGHLAKLSKWIRRHRKLAYSDFYSFSFDYDKRYKLYDHIIEKEKLEESIDYLEFGVSEGLSFKWWIDKIKDSNSNFYGFDTFTGLPEDWGPFKKGDMATTDGIPNFNDSRCTMYEGVFQKTLVDFLKTYDSTKRKVIHMDADLYSSTLYVLTTFAPYIKKDDIIFFDEFNVPMHEFKAFTEWTDSFYIDYEVLGAINNFYQIAIKIK